MFPHEIETERLRLVRLSRATVSAPKLYQHMRAGAPHMNEVSEYAMWDPHETPKDTHDFLVSVEEQWDDHERASYAIFVREDEEENKEREEGSASDELVGTTNLDIDWERRSAELGIWLRRRFWGRGYSGERAAALLELAFDRLDLELVGASHRSGNERSRRAIEKYVERFGGQHDGVLRDFFPRDGEVGDLHRYTISREQYREATRGECRETADRE
ncbi:GNAT family N-acetyltransferase [Halorussus pelagicus]|uniref:GNAT family N-acetyltransferase n=1 Tax=Halorussus pelagicus TaxID=2505977 RepID=UPI000FFC2DFC|nr:GNAT family protein [Halorussus pelagicus]